MSERLEWTKYIVESDALRLLGVGVDAKAEEATAVDAESLRKFTLELGKRDERLLRYAYYLLQPGVAQFVGHDLPELLRTLALDTTRIRFLARAAIRGKLDWGGTIRARATGLADSATFVVRRPQRSADRPENQLLKLLLEGMHAMLLRVEGRIGTGRTAVELLEIKEGLRIALRSPFLRQVKVPPRPTARMLALSRRHRNKRYAAVSELAVQLDRVQRRKWSAILGLLRSRWLVPLSDDDLFEVYVLTVLIDLLTKDLGFGDVRDWGLIRRGRQHVARLRRPDGTEARVYFDQTPARLFGERSEYLDIVRSYDGIRAVARRPDLTLVVRTPAGQERRLVLEVKKTEDDEYTRSSIYKCLAYLRDFSAIWADVPAQSPKAILFFPEHVTPKTAEIVTDLAIVAANDHARFRQLLMNISA